MTFLRGLLVCSLVLFILSPLLFSQQSRWENLSSIKPGQKVQIVESTLKSTTGTFVRFSPTDLTITVDKEELVVARDLVHRVTVLHKNRLRNVLIGLAAGGAAGAAAGAAVLERETGYAGAVAGVTGLFAGIGAGLGAIPSGNVTIYRLDTQKRTVRATLN